MPDTGAPVWYSHPLGCPSIICHFLASWSVSALRYPHHLGYRSIVRYSLTPAPMLALIVWGHATLSMSHPSANATPIRIVLIILLNYQGLHGLFQPSHLTSSWPVLKTATLTPSQIKKNRPFISIYNGSMDWECLVAVRSAPCHPRHVG